MGLTYVIGLTKGFNFLGFQNDRDWTQIIDKVTMKSSSRKKNRKRAFHFEKLF